MLRQIFTTGEMELRARLHGNIMCRGCLGDFRTLALQQRAIADHLFAEGTARENSAIGEAEKEDRTVA